MIPGIAPINPGLATGAASGIGGASLGGAASVDAGGSFASMLSQAAGRTVGTMQQAEQVSIDALQGKADMRQVVDAVMSAEQSMQAAIGIRDKIVSAYLEIGRMAI